jgi:guanine deaminase
MTDAPLLPRRAYRASILTARAGDEALRYLDDGLLAVDERGRIASVTPADDAPSGLGFVHDLRGKLLLPGFVDVHVHVPQTRVVGSASGPLLEWLEQTVFPEEARLREPDYASSVVDEFVRSVVRVGTTTVGAWSSSSPAATETLLSALDRAGLRAQVGLVLMDARCPAELAVPADLALAAAERLAATWHGRDDDRLRTAITPRFALSCSRELLEGAARLAHARGLLVQTHVSENPREGVETLRVHPIADDYLGVYEACGLVHERTLLAHAIHLSPSEWERAARAGVRIAHCPDSNFFLGSGSMAWAAPRDLGMRVGLGSDVAAGRSFDMRRAIASAWDAARVTGSAVTPAELFAASNLGGARALGLDARTGSLEPGKDADFIVLDRPAYAHGEAAALRFATFAADAAPVVRTYVRGRRVADREVDALAP